MDINQAFNEFKSTSLYQNRQEQIAKMVPLAREIITEVIHKDEISNQDLTGLIQTLRVNTSEANFEKYLNLILSDNGRREEFLRRFKENNVGGFTAAGKTAIKTLDASQLAVVQSFLRKVAVASDIQTIKEIIKEYESFRIPEVKQGVYSIWLYYLQPDFCPVLNNSHKAFLKEFFPEWDKTYLGVMDYFLNLRETIGERDLGIIDGFAYDYAHWSWNGEADDLESLEELVYSIDDLMLRHSWFSANMYDLVSPEVWNKTRVSWRFDTDSLNTLIGKKKVLDFIQYNNKEDGGGTEKNLIWILGNEENDTFSRINFMGRDWNEKSGLSSQMSPAAHDTQEAYGILAKELRKINIKQFFNNYFDYLQIFFEGEKTTLSGKLTSGTNSSSMEQALNQILFGPPGTGKTYNTVDLALKIVSPTFYEKNKHNRKELHDYFQQLLINDWDSIQKGQIAFCTFHQSFSYEDFIEGIKPQKPTEDDTFLKYEVQEGIFKKIADRARYFSSGLAQKDKESIHLSIEEFNNTKFYKLSLGDIQKPEDQAIFDYCIENDRIAIGFMEGIDLTACSSNKIHELAKDAGLGSYSAQAMSYFIHRLKIGDYVLVSKGNKKIRAIGKVTGEYFYDDESPIPYHHFRQVQWIAKETEIPVEEVYAKALSQQTIYKLNHAWVKPEFFIRSKEEVVDEEVKPFVLIIDEINRGNVSQIFGELITLIEEDKRAGKDEALEVTLPYSKEKFSVPANLYIIGTMNTADRSIEALDTALRRRFSFKEMAPNPALLSNIAVPDLDLELLLRKINKRIEKLLDKDHMIGHAYFMKLKHAENPWEELQAIFHNKLLPLLQEYFYGDFGKIELVIGKAFFEVEKEDTDTLFADSDYEFLDALASRRIYRLKNIDEMSAEIFRQAILSV